MEINRICCTTINIWLTYRIPIGSCQILHFPTTFDCRESSDPTSDNFLSESCPKESDNFRQDPIGSCRIPVGNCRIVWGFLQDPTGSDSSVEVENSVRLEKLFSTIQLFNYSTFEYSTFDYSTFDYSTIQLFSFRLFNYSTIQLSTIQLSTIQLFNYSAFDYSTFDYSTIQLFNFRLFNYSTFEN